MSGVGKYLILRYMGVWSCAFEYFLSRLSAHHFVDRRGLTFKSKWAAMIAQVPVESLSDKVLKIELQNYIFEKLSFKTGCNLVRKHPNRYIKFTNLSEKLSQFTRFKNPIHFGQRFSSKTNHQSQTKQNRKNPINSDIWKKRANVWIKIKFVFFINNGVISYCIAGIQQLVKDDSIIMFWMAYRKNEKEKKTL